MARKTISQRIALTGGDEIKRMLVALGEQGEKAFEDIQAAAEKLKGPGAEFARNMDAARKRIRDLGDEMRRVGEKVRNFGAGMSVGITAPITALGYKAVAAWNEQVDSIQKVEAAIASTGGVAGKTSAELQAMASRLQEVTTYGDEVTLSMQAVLLTFTNIRGNRFDEATEAILNMSAALGKDLQSSALQVGKALNDPVKGVAALAEAGIQFTDQQKATIRSLVEMGDVSGAQAVILKELRVQFGGMAEAMAKTPAGQLAQAMNALGDAIEHVGAVISPQITVFAAWLKEAAIAFQGLSDGAKTTIVIVGALAAVLGPVLMAIGQVVMGIGGLAAGFAWLMGALVPVLPAVSTLGAALAGVAAVLVSWPVLIVAAAAAIGALAGAIYARWDDIVAATADALVALESSVQATMDAVRDWFGSAFDWVKRKVGGVINWIAAKIRAVKNMLSSITGAGGGGGAETPGFAGGGRVRGPGTATSDSILARLSTGEFVIRAQAVRHYGSRIFDMLNSMALPRGLLPGYAAGGLVASTPGAASGSGGGAATINLSIGGELFGGLTAPRETAERLIRFATTEEVKKAGRRPAWFEGS